MRDTATPSMDDLAIQEELRSLLYQAIDLLPRKERELICAIYFDEVDKELYAEQIGMTIRGLNKKLKKVLEKLKYLMGKLYSILF